ncbi:MAG UNVERIFIED_CONTAM: hypothetical protein LVR18_19355 [Planctomycetaceae bacterium]
MTTSSGEIWKPENTEFETTVPDKNGFVGRLLGQTVATPGAVEWLQQAAVDAALLLSRHEAAETHHFHTASPTGMPLQPRSKRPYTHPHDACSPPGVPASKD